VQGNRSGALGPGYVYEWALSGLQVILEQLEYLSTFGFRSKFFVRIQEHTDAMSIPCVGYASIQNFQFVGVALLFGLKGVGNLPLDGLPEVFPLNYTQSVELIDAQDHGNEIMRVVPSDTISQESLRT
jgi:hypothetical protein